MNLIKKSFITILLLSTINCSIFATTLGPIDIFGYPDQNPAVDTLRNAFNYFADQNYSFCRQQFFIKDNFYSDGFVFSIPIHPGKEEMKYKLWLQLKPAPLVTINPGMGSLYLEQTLMVLANAFYNAGYSVLAISNAFNWEFMQSAASTPTPGYTIKDTQDTYYALYKITSHLKKKYGDLIQENIMVGYSMGGIYTLFMSILDEKYNLINYDRFVAINPPLDLLYGLKTLDSYFRIIDSWPRTKLESEAKKAFALFNQLVKGKINIDKKIPLTSEEAQYVIGLSFHNTLVNMLQSIAERNVDDGIFLNKFRWNNRKRLYRELNNYSYYKYIRLFVLPYYSKVFNTDFTMDDLNEWASLKNYEKPLSENKKIRILHNVNDFLLTEDDKVWFSNTFGNRLIYFSHGGHIGNMFFPEVQKFLLEAANPHNDSEFTGPEVERIKKEALEEYKNSLSPEALEKFNKKIVAK